MFPNYIPKQADRLSELTSITLTKQIQLTSISTPLNSQSIMLMAVRKTCPYSYYMDLIVLC